jgi:NADH dehydrogenase FAD-containing subunit
MEASSNSRPTVAVIGGGYGGITVAKALDDVADVVLVDPKEAFVHNVAAWRALVEPQWLEQIFFPYDRLLSDGRFLRDRAVEVEGRSVTLESGALLRPDYLVLATGSSYPFPAKIEETDIDTARARVLAAHEALCAADRVLLIGAGPSGLELAGEIKAVFPHKHVSIVDQAQDILEGPYDQALRDELRRQLGELGVELRLGTPLKALPSIAPATAGRVVVTTEDGEELSADIWFRCFGVAIHTEYARGALADARDSGGYLRVDAQLQVGERVFAIGDISDADRNMAGMAGAQARVVAQNIRAMIAGEAERESYQRFPPVIAVPLGPEGGAGQLPGQDGVAGPEVIAEVKGRAMMVERFGAMFDGVAVA